MVSSCNVEQHCPYRSIISKNRVSGSSSSSATWHAVNDLVEKVSNRTTLSTTGYQTAMGRLNKPEKSDADALMTIRRAQQYTDSAKRTYLSETLMNLANLQQSRIYRTNSGNLRGAIEMSPTQLTDCIRKCRENGFSNCDVQALEIGLHLRHKLRISDFTIYSNHKLSHNYVVINPSNEFPKGAIVDSWTGQGVVELDFKTRMKFKHREENYTVNSNMHEWIEMYGRAHVID
ncbi:Type III effector HopE1 [Pseudomonas coronafaciens pv. garcae]|uniref:Type III effector HopE1 n=2 Tax=Pseudomonas syringae group TaxID=136849 RepID=A0AB37QUC3_9PSED|nr:Type III effector HopE1 [Pseudomonas coronafaciens pv. garcae]